MKKAKFIRNKTVKRVAAWAAVIGGIVIIARSVSL